MDKKFNGEEKIGEIVSIFPGAATYSRNTILTFVAEATEHC